jgi:hypothetical protein
MFPDLDPVTASYHRCRASVGFIDTFYAHFLAKSREVADKFRRTISSKAANSAVRPTR